MRRLLDRFSLVNLVLIAAAGVVAAFAVDVEGYGLVKLSIYLAGITGCALLAYEHVAMIRRSHVRESAGTPIYIVSVTYAFLGLTLTFAGVVLIVIHRISGGILLIPDAVETRLLYGVVAAGCMALLVSALTFTIGRLASLLQHKTDAWPLTALSRERRRRRRPPE